MRPVFISYATTDRKEALAVCQAIERRGTPCWIACRDVQPGENYQEAIVGALRTARALVLVFSEAANNSDEIKKELSLVSRYKLPLIALRIEDVEPSDAFAYELSTRQWIDLFEDWDRSLDSLVRRIDEISPPGEDGVQPPAPRAKSASIARAAPPPPEKKRRFGTGLIAAIAALVMVAGVAGWYFLKPSAAVAHTMEVRLTDFERLSPELPETMPAALRDEIIAAFSDDGVVAVTTAAAPAAGDAPAYALGGTVRRAGDKLRVIARLSNERSGTTLWSHSFDYDSNHAERVPRWFAVDAGNLVRCGLFGISTYRDTLSDAVVADYLQFCHNVGLEFEPARALDFALKVVAAVPDFSWGWSAITIAAGSARFTADSPAQAAKFRTQARDAADKAVELDPSNSEALAYKSFVIQPGDLLQREALLRRALAARPLACGCEHHFYGSFLEEVGRAGDAMTQFRRSIDVLALNPSSQIALGERFLALGRTEAADKHYKAAFELSSDQTLAANIALWTASIGGDYAAALDALKGGKATVPPPLRPSLTAALEALVSGDSAAKARAAAALAALPPERHNRNAATLLGALGANAQALARVEAAAKGDFGARAWLFIPSMAGARADPAFPALAQRLGLIDYWRKSKTRPDFCSAAAAPPVCKAI